jgi:hypothetical protein
MKLYHEAGKGRKFSLELDAVNHVQEQASQNLRYLWTGFYHPKRKQITGWLKKQGANTLKTKGL